MFKYKVLWLDKNNEDRVSNINADDYHDVVEQMKKVDPEFNLIALINVGPVK